MNTNEAFLMFLELSLEELNALWAMTPEDAPIYPELCWAIMCKEALEKEKKRLTPQAGAQTGRNRK